MCGPALSMQAKGRTLKQVLRDEDSKHRLVTHPRFLTLFRDGFGARECVKFKRHAAIALHVGNPAVRLAGSALLVRHWTK